MKTNTSWKFTDESFLTFQSSVSGPGEFGLDLFLKCIFSHLYSRATATMNYHHNPLDTESNTYAKAILQGGYSPPSTEPLYEVPKYTQEELEQPKSSSTGM